jgi:hypothetical protein
MQDSIAPISRSIILVRLAIATQRAPSIVHRPYRTERCARASRAGRDRRAPFVCRQFPEMCSMIVVVADGDRCTGYTRCGMHGYCVLTDPNDCNSSPRCNCTDGYTGEYCTDQPFNSTCTPGYCNATGTINCTSTLQNGPVCSCKDCWSGPTCAVCTYSHLNKCVQLIVITDGDRCTGYTRCGAHGNCVLTDPNNCSSSPRCNCTDGYTGEYCDQQSRLNQRQPIKYYIKV